MIDELLIPKPADGIKIIEYSRKCYAASTWGLVPFLGFPFAIRAFVFQRKAQTLGKGCWNPARKELSRGTTLCVTGFLVTILPLVFLIVGRLVGAWPWTQID